MCDIRYLDGVLQCSDDGGATWTDVPRLQTFPTVELTMELSVADGLSSGDARELERELDIVTVQDLVNSSESQLQASLDAGTVTAVLQWMTDNNLSFAS